MTSQPLRTTRRAQAAVAGLGLAGAIGAATAIGLATAGSTTPDPSSPATDGAQPGTWSQSRSDDEDEYGEGEYGDDGEGEGEESSRTSGQFQAPPVAPQPPSGGGSHAATSGS